MKLLVADDHSLIREAVRHARKPRGHRKPRGQVSQFSEKWKT